MQDRKRPGENSDDREVRQMTETDLRHKLDNQCRQDHSDEQEYVQSRSKTKCYNCNKKGHHWSDYKNEPYCYSC